jgi:hypothetical protein|tara:strand:- start:8586 stop:8699 length:114 start_codon:yes stop_codon:yes gene_type:complete
MSSKDIFIYWVFPLIIGSTAGLLTCQIVVNKILGAIN